MCRATRAIEHVIVPRSSVLSTNTILILKPKPGSAELHLTADPNVIANGTQRASVYAVRASRDLGMK